MKPEDQLLVCSRNVIAMFQKDVYAWRNPQICFQTGLAFESIEICAFSSMKIEHCEFYVPAGYDGAYEWNSDVQGYIR